MLDLGRRADAALRSIPLLGLNIEGTNLPIHFLVNEPLAIRIAGTRLAKHSRPARGHPIQIPAVSPRPAPVHQ